MKIGNKKIYNQNQILVNSKAIKNIKWKKKQEI